MNDESGLRERLAAELKAAMKSRDRVALSALRSALARIANAEAVPIDTLRAAGAIEEGAVGVGAADAPRRDLDDAAVRALVEAEADEHDHAAGLLESSGQTELAASLRTQAQTLRSFL